MSSRKNYGQRISFDREKKIDAVLILISFIFVLGFLYLDSDLTGYAVLRTTNDTFDDGDFNRTFWNKTGFVQLNYTQGFFKGNYSSSVIDAGSLVSWSNISWCESASCLNMYGEELPANQKGQQRVADKDYRINMTGNVLLMHFNNQSAFGETDARNTANAVYDFSGNGNNGTLGNASTNTDPTLNTTNCIFGNCYTYAGPSSFINVTDHNSLSMASFSISAWAYLTSTGLNRQIVFKGENQDSTTIEYTLIYFDATTRFRFYPNSSESSESTTAVELNKWYHLVGTYSPSTANLYVNGILEDTDTIVRDAAINDDVGLGIGSEVSSNPRQWMGNLDEIAIWNRTLSATEIKQLYLAGATNLSLQVKSCNDAGCSGENFVGPDNTTNTYFTNASLVQLNTTITPNNRWFQYKYLFQSNITGGVNVSLNSTTPELYNVTIQNNASSNLETVTGLIPANNVKFNVSDVIEVSVNITDDQAPYPQTVLANITQPNGTIRQLTLTNSTYNNKFNKTFTTELAGRYILKIIANDTDNNVNNTEVTAWDVDANLTYLNRSTSITAWGYLNGIFNNTYFNSSNYSVQLNTSAGKFRGNYTSQIFTIGTNIGLNNLSWCETSSCLNIYGEELPANQKGGTKQDNRINMSGNMLLMHFNNDSLIGENDTSIFDFSANQNNGSYVKVNGTSSFNSTNKVLGIRSLTLDGDADYINLTNNINFTGNVSFSAWIYPTNYASNFNSLFFRGLFCSTGSRVRTPSWIRLLHGGSGGDNPSLSAIQFSVQSSTTCAGGAAKQRFSTQNNTVPLNNWTHIAITVQNNHLATRGVSIYINAINQTLRTDHSGTPLFQQFDNHSMLVGATKLSDITGYSNFFQGEIDELAIWNVSLSATEIKQLYLAGVNNLSLQVRSCNDSSCSGETFVGPDNTTNTYFTNASLVELNTTITPLNKWFQYITHFEGNTSGSVNTTVNGTSPELWNLTFSSGNMAPVINSNTTSPTTPLVASSVQLIANVSDADGTPSDILEVNFTLVAPNRTVVINNLNGTLQGSTNADNWSSTSYITQDVGIWKWYVNASDGSATDTDFGTFNINDTTNPSITLTNPTNATVTLSTSVTFNATLTEDINLINTSIYGTWAGGWHRNQSASIVGTSNNSNFTVANLIGGTYLWNIQACDNSSNCDFATSNFTITINTAPVINSNITSPTTPSKTKTIQIIANVSDDDGTPSNLISVNFTLKAPNGTKVIDHVNGTLQGGANADNWSSTSYTVLDNGTWTWTINVTDSSSGTDNDIGTFTINNAAPVINSNITSPSANLNLSNLQIIANVSDADGNNEIREVNFTLIAPNGTKVINNINGTLVGASDNWSSSSYQIFDNGTWTWTVNLTDKYYDADTDIGYFTITDSTVPSITSESRNPTTVTTATSVTLNATITEDLRLDTIIITEDSSGTWKNYTITNPVSNVYSFSLHSNNFSQSQTVNYRWYANDSSNNLAASALQTFVVGSTQTQNTPSGSPTGSSTATSPTTAQTTQPGTTTTSTSTTTSSESTTTQTTQEQPTTIPQVDLTVIGIQTQEISPEITSILGGFVNTITSEVNQETTTIRKTEDGVKINAQEAKLEIDINEDTKTVENLKLDLGIIKQIKEEQAIQFEENYFDVITTSLESSTNQLKDNTNLLMNMKVTKAQLQIKEILLYAILPILVILIIFGVFDMGLYKIYTKFSRKHKLVRLVETYNQLLIKNQIKEAKLVKEKIKLTYIRLPYRVRKKYVYLLKKNKIEFSEIELLSKK